MSHNDIIMIALAALAFIFFVFVIFMSARLSAMNKKLSKFLKGRKVSNMETLLMEHFKDVKKLEQVIVKQQGEIDNLRNLLNRCYQKTSILRYDAYEESNGKLSFVLCMLDKKNDGILINNVYSRDGSYSYVKEVIDAESPIKLTIEEEEVLMRTAEKE